MGLMLPQVMGNFDQALAQIIQTMQLNDLLM
jgi:hypothetical protein